jgi:hypothetical protein
MILAWKATFRQSNVYPASLVLPYFLTHFVNVYMNTARTYYVYNTSPVNGGYIVFPLLASQRAL